VGIGISAPTEMLEIFNASSPAIQLNDGGDYKSIFRLAGNDLEIRGSSGSMEFYTGSADGDSSSERMRIDASGNLLVGKTSTAFGTAGLRFAPTGAIDATVSGDGSLFLNRLGSDGPIQYFYKDGTNVGSISATGGNININSAANGILSTVGTRRLNWDAGQLYPQVDNTYNLGHGSYRYDDIFATNGTIQTSDRNEKQDIEALSDAEQRVAVAAKGLLRKFRWISSVEENADDARIHFGIIAQDLQDAFTAEGLDAGRYAMFISSTWTDEDGNEQTRLGVRYSELLAFIISAI